MKLMNNILKIIVLNFLFFFSVISLISYLELFEINFSALFIGVTFFVFFSLSVILIGRAICFKSKSSAFSALLGLNLKLILIVFLFYLIPGKDSLYIFSFCAPLILALSVFSSVYFAVKTSLDN